MRILSGIQPSGIPHLGNYFGMMKQIIDDQYKGETFLFIADLHSLTVTPDPKLLSERTLNVALDFLACGLDPEKVVFFKQSDIKSITELSWILSCCTPMGLIERCHSYKDKIANGIMPNCGLFFYPILMTADILMYKSDIVPVGKDQKQHVEVARDVAIKFNLQYGETFIVPEPKIKEEVAVTPGIDGRKMSKSYGNSIPLFGDQKQIRKIFMKIVTDSKTPEEPKDPSTCNIFALYKLFASKEQVENMSECYTAGGLMYGNAKQELFELYLNHFSSMQKKRDELVKNLDYVNSILKKGAQIASETAEITMNEVKIKVGLK